MDFGTTTQPAWMNLPQSSCITKTELHVRLSAPRLSLPRTTWVLTLTTSEKVSSDDENRSELMAICQDIREIKRALASCSIVLVGPDANNAAHLCAKQTRSDRRRCLWINYNPGFLVDTLRSDCNPAT